MIRRRHLHRDLPHRPRARLRRQLHAVARLGQLRRRERGQRPGAVRLPVSGVQAGVLELSDRRPRRRSAPPRAALGQLQPGLRVGPDAERAAGARERRALRRRQHQRRRPAALCHQPGQRVSDAAGVHRDDVFLRTARRVPHRRADPHRPRGQLRPEDSGHRPDAAVRAAAAAERVRSVPAVRVRQHRVRHRQRRQRRRRQPAADRYHRADPRHDRVTVRRLQPVHHHAGARRELGLRPGLRPGAQPLRLHDAADAQAVVWSRF